MLQDDFYELFMDYPEAITVRKVFIEMVKDQFPEKPTQANYNVILHDMKMHIELVFTVAINTEFAYCFVKRLVEEHGVKRLNADWAASVW